MGVPGSMVHLVDAAGNCAGDSAVIRSTGPAVGTRPSCGSVRDGRGMAIGGLRSRPAHDRCLVAPGSADPCGPRHHRGLASQLASRRTHSTHNHLDVSSHNPRLHPQPTEPWGLAARFVKDLDPMRYLFLHKNMAQRQSVRRAKRNGLSTSGSLWSEAEQTVV